MKMTTVEVTKLIGCSAENVSASKGIFTYRKGFFYTHGQTADPMVAKVQSCIPDAIIVDSGTVWKPFKGGAPLEKSSHFFVKFKVL